MRIFRDNTASAAPVNLLYHGAHHTARERALAERLQVIAPERCRA